MPGRPPGAADEGAASSDEVGLLGLGGSTTERRLVVSVAPGAPVTLTWKRGAEVLSVVDVPFAEAFERRGETVRAPALASRFGREWTAQGEHKDPRDRRRDRAMLQVADATELRFLVAVLDALYEPKRDAAAGPSGRAFEVTLGMGPPGEPVDVSGRLLPEVIQRIVRAHFASLRACYEAGLARDAKLAGNVSARFTIGTDGTVTKVADAGSSCVIPRS